MMGGHRMPGRRQNAFTLIELIVVFVILALGLAVVAPVASRTLTTTQTKAAARDLAAALRYTRSRAVQLQSEALVELDLENRTYAAHGRNPKSFPELENLTLVTASSERISDQRGAIRFFADGSSTGGRVSLGSARLILHIDVDWLTGAVEILQ